MLPYARRTRRTVLLRTKTIIPPSLQGGLTSGSGLSNTHRARRRHVAARAACHSARRVLPALPSLRGPRRTNSRRPQVRPHQKPAPSPGGSRQAHAPTPGASISAADELSRAPLTLRVRSRSVLPAQSAFSGAARAWNFATVDAAEVQRALMSGSVLGNCNAPHSSLRVIMRKESERRKLWARLKDTH